MTLPPQEKHQAIDGNRGDNIRDDNIRDDNSRDDNIVWHDHPVARRDRERLHRHQGAVIWFTGLSGSGKSTLAGQLEQRLHQLGVSTYLLDGDNVRHGLCRDLGFSDA
ncbi:adenylyl-sulfate kinase, partial [Candidatus Symbiopectobacterium sp. NZEC135]|nr:adenylyl-sulfate kinase [Candidatus Symbiopectobacterium sp. NZEC135]